MATLSKTQIDRLGDRLRKGSSSEADLQLLDDYRHSFGDAHDTVVRAIREKLNLLPTGRPEKSTTSIVDKLRRESIRLSQIQDLAGCRIVVTDSNEQDRVVGSLQALFPGAAIAGRRSLPSHGYRAVHVIAKISGLSIEIQVRSTLQHLWAEFSERLSDRIDPGIKYGSGGDQIKKVLLDASELAATFEQMEKNLSKIVSSSPRGLLYLYEMTTLKEKLIEYLKGLIFPTENLN